MIAIRQTETYRKMTIQQTYPWDAAEYLETKEDIIAYL